jgi:hypothetical protein
MLAALVLLFALALVVGWEVFCLADLAQADKVRSPSGGGRSPA